MSLIAPKLLNLPEYHDIYRFFIVEELVLVESPLHYHHGKCALIGRVAFEGGNYYLENIRIRNIRPQCQIPSGQLRILLLLAEGLGDGVIKSTVDLSGEAVFWRRADDTCNHSTSILPKTTVELVRKIRSHFFRFHEESNFDVCNLDHISRDACEFDEDKVWGFLEAFSTEYVHAIKVHSISVVDDADEVIVWNLKMRKLMHRLDALDCSS